MITQTTKIYLQLIALKLFMYITYYTNMLLKQARVNKMT